MQVQRGTAVHGRLVRLKVAWVGFWSLILDALLEAVFGEESQAETLLLALVVVGLFVALMVAGGAQRLLAHG